MKNTYLFVLALVGFSIASFFTIKYFTAEADHDEMGQFEEEEGDKRTRIDEMMRQQFELTKDPALGYPPTERLLDVMTYIQNTAFDKNTPISAAKWRERGPYQVGGRTRTIMIDANDPTGKTAFAAGVAGGLWRTKDILGANVVWEPINDYLENLAVVTLVQDPSNPQVMYFGTGEAYFNLDAVSGLGVWKSTNGGLNWNRLPSTISFEHTMRMAVHSNGDVYAATSNDGLQRSQDGGQTWTKVLGIGISTGSSNAVNDVEIGADGAIWTITGYRSAAVIYKSPAGANIGDINNWERVGRSTTGFVGGQDRVELACAATNPDVVYALCSDAGAATYIYKTTNGGVSWVKTSNAPSVNGNGNFAGDQAWYDLDIEVDPTNENRVVVGGVDVMMSTTGGTTWTSVTAAYSNVAPYIHPDQHFIYYHPSKNGRLFIGNDGGIYRSDNANDGPSAIRFKVINARYNVTQYYGCAIHPGYRSDYFIAGSQDNGTHAFNSFSIDDVDHIWGGDGMICHIDQTDGMIQVVSSQNGNYGLSTDGGVNFSGGVSVPSAGFVNVSEYDDDANILYAQTIGGSYYRWDVMSGTNETVTMTGASNLGSITHLQTSPNVSNRLYVGTSFGRVIRVDDANVGTTKNIVSSSIGSGSVSCIAVQKGNENHLLATVSNYGTVSIHESFNNGSTWQSVEGNLPDMPVRWVLFDPIDPDQAMIATEAGVWVTEDLDGSNTVWQPSLLGMPITRIDMLQYRESDNLIVAATHGRGLFTTDYRSPASAAFQVDRIGYVGTPFQFENRSYNPNVVAWNFGDGTTSTAENPVHSYTALGTYTVSLTINDTLTTSQTITILPNRTVPYTKDENAQYDGGFENNAQNFAVYTIGGTSFELGVSTFSGKSGVHGGSKAYVTGINENFYQNNSHSMLYTPNYNLAEEGIYELSFWAKYNFQFGWDGFLVEYSTDLGVTWQTLGDEKTDWYNYSNNQTATAFPMNMSYITGTQNVFKEYKLDLSNVVGSSDVAFRFVFKTNEQGVYQGLAIDDFQIKAYIGTLETKLIDFDAVFINAEQAEVTWSTYPEYECEGFDLEISENGRDFIFYGFTQGQGSSINLTNYKTRPSNLKKDLYFARLKVKNFDGSFFYSDIIVLQRKQVDLDIVNVFPNPFNDFIGFTFNNIINEDITVNLYEASGKLVYSETGKFTGIYKTIATADYARGVYFLQVIVGTKQFSRKLLK